MAEKRNELTRVQLPAIIHLTRLGYKYFGKISEESAGTVFDADTNILRQVFIEQFAKLNPDNAGEAEQMLVTIKQELDNDDLGRSFYKRLVSMLLVSLDLAILLVCYYQNIEYRDLHKIFDILFR